MKRFGWGAMARIGVLAVSMWTSVVFVSAAQAAVSEQVVNTITQRLQQARPDFEVVSVKPSAAAGLFEVQLSGGPVIYSTADGAYFVLGDLFQVEPGGLANLSELQRDKARLDLMATIDREDLIVFAAQGTPRGAVWAFTDVDCGYCQKLHQEVPELNRLGVEVRYVAYPRAGVGSDAYRKMASAWCADDRQDALTKLKNRQPIPDNVCSDNPIADQFMLGQQAGVRGTPAMVLEDGTMIPGYMPAAELAARLGLSAVN